MLPNFLVDEVPVIGVVLELEVACILFPVVGLGLVLVGTAVEINCPRLSKAGDFNLMAENPDKIFEEDEPVIGLGLKQVIGLVLVLVGIAVEINCPRLSKAGDFNLVAEMLVDVVALELEVACILVPVTARDPTQKSSL